MSDITTTSYEQAAEIERLTEQLKNLQAVVRAREERVSMLTDRLRERGLAETDDLTDVERGLAFLERLRDAVDEDWIRAYNLFYAVFDYGADYKRIEPDLAVLGRVLRGSE